MFRRKAAETPSKETNYNFPYFREFSGEFMGSDTVGAAPNGTATAWLRRLASLKLTLVIFVLFGTGVTAAYFGGLPPTWAVAVPLFLFAVNLLAAILFNPAFRRQTPLLVFHLALLAVILLLAAGRLTYLKGRLELTEGETFRGELTGYESGPFHPWGLDRFVFAQGAFSIDYDVNIQRNKTHSQVRWIDAAGAAGAGIVGDDRPLVLEGYRFYTTHNKGFAPAFSWHPADGAPVRRGSIHLPGYPANEYRQTQRWTIPGTSIGIWTMLQFDETILDPARPSQFRVPQEHRLVLRVSDDRHELRPGEYIDLPGGRLVYEGLRTWMGYQVFYDWTITWLLAACLVAVLSLAWHYWQKCSARPWSAGDQPEAPE